MPAWCPRAETKVAKPRSEAFLPHRHPGEVQISYGYGLVLPRKVQGGFEMDSCGPVVAPFLLPEKAAVGLLQFLQGWLQRCRESYLAAITGDEEILQDKVHARYFGSRGLDNLMLCAGDNNKVDVAQSIPLDCEGLDVSLDQTVLLFADGDAVAGGGVPALFQGEALVLHPFPERRWPNLSTGIPGMVFSGSQSTAGRPFRCSWISLPTPFRWEQPLQFRQLLHQPEEVEVLLVPLVQGDAMIPNLGGNVDLSMQFPVAFSDPQYSAGKFQKRYGPQTRNSSSVSKGGDSPLGLSELGPEKPGGHTLQLLDGEVRAVHRRGPGKREKVQMAHNFSREDLKAVLCAPDHVVADIENGFDACRPTFAHAGILPRHNKFDNCTMLNSCFHLTTKVRCLSAVRS